MNLLDGTIVAVSVLSMLFVAWFTKRYTRSVSDFLSANRCAGRYMLSIADGMAGVGLVNILAVCEMYYRVGFSTSWWMTLQHVAALAAAVTGWVAYRFRETRALTMAQFFEMRYSRKFRIFAGIICWLAGIFCYGIFPIVTARVIVYLLELPLNITVLGFSIPTTAIVMPVMLSISAYLAISGGQIAIMVADFLQASFANLVFLALVVFFVMKFNWSDILEGLRQAPENQSMINPFKIGAESSFSLLFFASFAFMTFYGFMSWQANQGYYCAAKNPHEAKMARIIANLRWTLLWTMVLVFSIVAFAVMHNPKFSSIAESAQNVISRIPEAQIQEQMRVPIILTHILPTGLLGLVCAVMVAIAISTDDTNLHSWGSIFIQDVVIPLRKKPLPAKQHMMLLRLSVIGVALFAYVFSLLFPLKDYLFMFMQITMTIYVGGAGIAIIGGLYWKRGSIAGAWSSMITGSVLALGGIILQNIIWPYVLPGLKESYPNITFIQHLPERFPFNGMVMSMIFALSATAVYIVVSFFSKDPHFNLDRMLHRGNYDVKQEHINVEDKPVRGWKVLINWGKEFSRTDRFICSFTVSLSLFWVVAFIIGTIVALTIGIPDEFWPWWWFFRLSFILVLGCVVVVLLLFGGFRDMREMFKVLKTAKRDEHDDGRVVDGHNLADE